MQAPAAGAAGGFFFRRREKPRTRPMSVLRKRVRTVFPKEPVLMLFISLSA